MYDTKPTGGLAWRYTTLTQYTTTMISTFEHIKNDVIRKLGVSTTNAFYTDAILDAWIKGATRWATSFKKWPFTEGRVSTTFAGTEEWSFEGYKADSFRMMQIGGKRLDKLNFEDYQIFREEDETGADRVFTDYGRLVFINPNIDLSGTLTAYGQYTPVDIDSTDLNSTTVFSNGDEEGNEAIVEEVISYAKTREQKDKEAEYYHQRAIQILDTVYKKVADEQFNYKTHRARGGMWKRIDVTAGGVEDDKINRDQFLF